MMYQWSEEKQRFVSNKELGYITNDWGAIIDSPQEICGGAGAATVATNATDDCCRVSVEEKRI